MKSAASLDVSSATTLNYLSANPRKWSNTLKQFVKYQAFQITTCYLIRFFATELRINPFHGTSTPPENIRRPEGFLMFSGGIEKY